MSVQFSSQLVQYFRFIVDTGQTIIIPVENPRNEYVACEPGKREVRLPGVKILDFTREVRYPGERARVHPASICKNKIQK